MSRNVQQKIGPTRFSELKRLRDSTSQKINAETDKLCKESKNMHSHYCTSEDRRSADVQVGPSRQIQDLYRGRYQLKVKSAHSSYVAAQPEFQKESIQKPPVDIGKHMNVKCHKTIFLQPVSSTIYKNTELTRKTRGSKKTVNDYASVNRHSADEQTQELYHVCNKKIVQSTLSLLEAAQSEIQKESIQKPPVDIGKHMDLKYQKTGFLQPVSSTIHKNTGLTWDTRGCKRTVNDYSSVNRHSADEQKQELYHEYNKKTVQSTLSLPEAAQPEIQKDLIQKPPVDISKHMNVKCQKTIFLQPVSSTIHNNTGLTRKTRGCKKTVNDYASVNRHSADDQKQELYHAYNTKIVQSTLSLLETAQSEIQNGSIKKRPLDMSKNMNVENTCQKIGFLQPVSSTIHNNTGLTCKTRGCKKTVNDDSSINRHSADEQTQELYRVCNKKIVQSTLSLLEAAQLEKQKESIPKPPEDMSKHMDLKCQKTGFLQPVSSTIHKNTGLTWKTRGCKRTVNDYSSVNRHSADEQKQELYHVNNTKTVQSTLSLPEAAQPEIQKESIQEQPVDMSKNMNIDCQKIEAQDGPVSNTFRVNRIDTFNQTNNVGTVSNGHDIQVDYCPAPVPEFIGRKKELADLKKIFEDHQVIAIVGMGGVGKTQLARKFAELYRSWYQYRFWIEADTIEKLNSSFHDLAKKLDVKTINKNILVNDIYKAFVKGQALLIFDNVIKPEHVFEYLPTRFQLTDVTVNILITSIWTYWTREKCVILQPFEAEVSLHLFRKLIEDVSVETDEENWMELANTMGHLPLAQRLSSSFIKKQKKYNSKFTISDYTTGFTTRVDKLLKKTTLEYGNNRSIYVTTIMTLELLGENSMKLVNVAAYFNPDKILNSDLEPLIPKECDLTEALADVVNYSLFHKEGPDRFSMHRLIQRSIQLYQQEKKMDENNYSLTLEYTLQNPHSNQCDSVFAYANQYKNIIVQNYKTKQLHRPVILKYLLRNKCTEVLNIIFEHFKDHIDKYDAIYIEVGSQCPDMFVFILSYLTSTSHKQDLSDKLFQFACEKDNKSSVQFLLENKLISVTELYDDNQTLLHRAAAYASSSVVTLILEWNIDIVNVQDTQHNTALHTVIKSYNNKPKSQIIETVRVLIDNRASVVIRDGADCTALHYATSYEDIELVSLICQSDNTVVNIVDNNGRTSLQRLCMYYTDGFEKRVIDIARVLIKNGASILKRDGTGWTALHYVTLFKAVELVSLISQSNNTVVNIVDNKGRTALHCLCMHYPGRSEVGVIDIARVLIKNNASVMIRDQNDRTALHSAASYAHAQVVSLLIQSNKEVIDIVDNRRNTALHLVARNYKEENTDCVEQTISILIKNGLSIHTLNSDGRSPLDTISYKYKHLLRRLADET